jgi:hypothetical protein
MLVFRCASCNSQSVVFSDDRPERQQTWRGINNNINISRTAYGVTSEPTLSWLSPEPERQ